MSTLKNQQVDVCIHGAGIVGSTLALLLAKEGLRVGLLSTAAMHNSKKDVRAYALNYASKNLLETLRVWPDAGHATPVVGMQVHGDMSGEVNFTAKGQLEQAVAWVVDVPALEAKLAQAIKFQPLIEVLEAQSSKVQSVEVDLTVVCEGKHSSTRQNLAIEFEVTPYHQNAIAARLRTTLPHANIARQWFQNGEILALLPLSDDATAIADAQINSATGNYVALVWSVSPERAQSLMALDEGAFALAVAQASEQALGDMQLCSERGTWPLQLSRARHWVGRHAQAGVWALAGDAAHTVHPLSGQGLNLGLGDVCELAKVLAQREVWRKVSDLKLLRRYERKRKLEVLTVGTVTDGLQQLFARTELPLASLRNWGMQGFERSGSIKRWVANRAMGL